MKKIYILLLLAIATSMTSCIREKFDGCPQGVNLHYYCRQQGSFVNFQAGDAQHVAVYVFDDRGIYLDTYSVESRGLLDGNQMFIPLAAGSYSVVVWAGNLSYYSTAEKRSETDFVLLQKGQTTLENFRFMVTGAALIEGLGRDEASEVEIAYPESLYYGLVENVVVSDHNVSDRRVDLARNSKEVRVSVRGLRNLSPSVVPVSPIEARAGEEDAMLDVYCSATNGMYDYRNSLDMDSYKIRYLSGSSRIQDQIFVSSSKVLRLLINGDLNIRVMARDTRKIIIDQNAMELLLKTTKYRTQEDVDNEDVFEFEFDISESLEVQVTVNGWKVFDVIPLL